MSTAAPVKSLKFNRTWRWVLAGLLVFNCAMTVLNIAAGRGPLALVSTSAVCLLAGALWVNARTIKRLERQCQPPAVVRPSLHPEILERRPAPFCWRCEMAEADSDEYRERLHRVFSLSFGFHLTPPYESHRDCWVTTGSEKELERMLRHVTWESS